MAKKDEYPTTSEPITQGDFVEWTKETFALPNNQRPPKLIVFRQEDYDYFIEKGIPKEQILLAVEADAADHLTVPAMVIRYPTSYHNPPYKGGVH